MSTQAEANHLTDFLFQEGIKLNEVFIVVVKPVSFSLAKAEPIFEWKTP